MGESKHTPEPWTVAEDEDGGDLVVREGDYYVATVHGGFIDPNRQKTNARLLAAAPEMKEALEAYDEYMGRWYDGPESPALHPDAAANWKRVRRALAKANGEAGQ